LAFLGTIDQSDLTVLKWTKQNGTKWTELNAARNKGPELKICGTKINNINSIYLINYYLADYHRLFLLNYVRLFYLCGCALRTYAASPVVDAHGCTFDGNRHCIASPGLRRRPGMHLLQWICENVLYASSQPNKFFLQHTELLQSIYSWVATWQKNEENKMPPCIHMSQQIRLQGNLMEQCQLYTDTMCGSFP
jgi:hypothetical protein